MRSECGELELVYNGVEIEIQPFGSPRIACSRDLLVLGGFVGLRAILLIVRSNKLNRIKKSAGRPSLVNRFVF